MTNDLLKTSKWSNSFFTSTMCNDVSTKIAWNVTSLKQNPNFLTE